VFKADSFPRCLNQERRSAVFEQVAEAVIDPSGVTAPKEETGGAAGQAPAARRPAALFLNAIRDEAYQKWLAAGSPAGDCTRFWLDAERELLEGRR
jgi:hypothetical protein